ncbi:RAD9A protein, partial [Atractosteus spatula]|nr:RAD9A protein [Atractosteus spatula]
MFFLSLCLLVSSVIAKSIHSLSKIGEELYLEPLEEGLALRTVNLSRSAYACFLFAPLFFQKYVITASPFFRCKMASVQAVFKSLSTLEKTVEKCRINLNSHRNRLTFQLHCRHGLMKTHNLSFQDSESLQAVFEKENCANHLQAQPRPVVFSISDPVLEVNFVLATLSDEEMPPTSSHCLCLLSLSSSHPPPPPQDEFFTDEMDSYMIAMEMSALDGDLAGQQPDNSSVGQQRDVSDMPVRDRESDTDVPSDTEAQRDSGGPPNKKVLY